MLEWAKEVRKTTIAIALWFVVLLVLAGKVATVTECGGSGTGTKLTCRQVGGPPKWEGDLFLGLWLLVLVGLVVLWFRTRPRPIACPHCGKRTRKRTPYCANCGGDLKATVSTGSSSSTSRVTFTRDRY